MRIQLCVYVIFPVASGSERTCKKGVSLYVSSGKLFAIMNGVIRRCCQACTIGPRQYESTFSEILAFHIIRCMDWCGLCVWHLERFPEGLFVPLFRSCGRCGSWVLERDL